MCSTAGIESKSGGERTARSISGVEGLLLASPNSETVLALFSNPNTYTLAGSMRDLKGNPASYADAEISWDVLKNHSIQPQLFPGLDRVREFFSQLLSDQASKGAEYRA